MCASRPASAETHTIDIDQDVGPNVMEQIAMIRRRCAIAHKVESDDIDIWTHGITSLAGIIAICITSEVRPRLTYRTAAEENSIVLFSKASSDTDCVKFAWQEDPVIEVRRTHDNILEEVKALLISIKILDSISRRMLYSVFVVSLLSLGFSDESRTRYAHFIVALLRDELRVPNALTMELSILESIKADFTPSAPTIHEELTNSLNSRLPGMLEDDHLSQLIDQCPIPGCGQAVGWDDIEEASCLGGHPLGGRCQITFLPLLEPGLSKRCSDCYRQYFNELVHPEMMGEDSEPENKQCLVRRLLDWFEICPYCGGKFFTDS